MQRNIPVLFTRAYTFEDFKSALGVSATDTNGFNQQSKVFNFNDIRQGFMQSIFDSQAQKDFDNNDQTYSTNESGWNSFIAQARNLLGLNSFNRR